METAVVEKSQRSTPTRCEEAVTVEKILGKLGMAIAGSTVRCL
jgi:hypothetical protein